MSCSLCDCQKKLLVNDTLQFTKIRNVKTPTRAHDGDAGIDFYIPEDYFANGYMLMGVNDTYTIDLGIKVHVPYGYMLIAGNKSGVSKKKGLVYGGGVIDHGYEGEISVQLIKVCEGTEDEDIHYFATKKWISANGDTISHKATRLKNGEKIIQLMLVPVANHQTEELTNDEYNALCGSQRGANGFGSTGV